jgi:hypothetical protein
MDDSICDSIAFILIIHSSNSLETISRGIVDDQLLSASPANDRVILVGEGVSNGSGSAKQALTLRGNIGNWNPACPVYSETVWRLIAQGIEEITGAPSRRTHRASPKPGRSR